jgi:hypothetical protein
LVLGVVAVAGPLGFIAFLVFPLWVLAVAIAVFRAEPSTAPITDGHLPDRQARAK